MGDQQRWFKLWVTALYDDHLQRLSIADRWAWVALGAYTKAHGTRGTVMLSEANATLASALGIMAADLYVTVSRLPHLSVGECANGEFTVTWQNWRRYQEDSTVTERVARLRSKKREEKNRIRSTPPTPQSLSRDNGSSENHEARKRHARQLLKQVFPNLEEPT